MMTRFSLIGGLIVTLVVLLGLWEVAACLDTSTAFFFSSPSAVTIDLWRYALRDGLWTDLAATAVPAVIGLSLGLVVGGGTGFLLSAAPIAARLVRPTLSAAAAFPVFVLAPMTLLWFGSGLLAGKVFLAFISCVFVFLDSAYAGALSAPEPISRHLKIHGFTRRQELVTLRLPYALDRVVQAMRAGAAMALLGVFIGEYVIAEHGLAKTMLVEASRYNVTRVLSAAVCFTLLVSVFALFAILMRAYRNQLIRWVSVSRLTRLYGSKTQWPPSPDPKDA